MSLLTLVFLIAGTIFSVHETLLVKRHDLKYAAKGIDALFGSSRNPAEIKKDMLAGLRFVEKPKNLGVAVFSLDGRPLAFSGDAGDAQFDPSNYPKTPDDHIVHTSWRTWNHWRIMFYFHGENCLVRLKLQQRLEIQDDIALFLFGSLPLILVLSFLAGRLITAKVVERFHRVEDTAAQIAAGNLSSRIPPSAYNDELSVVEANLNKAFEELESSFNKIMEFSSDIAHELRTPLTVVAGKLEVALREPRNTEEYQATMAEVIEEIAGLHRIIDDMLILVKPENAYKSITFEEMNISEMVRDIATSHKVLADTMRIAVEIKIEDGLKILGNPSLTRLIFTNIIGNAIKFAPESGQVEVRLTSSGDNVVFSVTDNGPGIPEDELDKIFTRFYRSKSNNDKRGSGLGLAIVKKVCDIHDATVSVESSPGHGATFTVKFKQKH